MSNLILTIIFKLNLQVLFKLIQNKQNLKFWKLRCEYPINECESNPCRNGATCFDGYNKYQCSCVPGTQGINCEYDIDECQSCPCKNGATCVTPHLNVYMCNCLPGFTGINCETPNDPCTSKPCQNNAVCILDSPNYYRCVCPLGFTGTYCEIPVDQCTYQNCIRNYTNLNINLYGLPYNFNFLSYQDCILRTWSFLNPSS
jgi:hypothetical protein